MIATNDIQKPKLGRKTDEPARFDRMIYQLPSVGCAADTTVACEIWPAWGSLLGGYLSTYRAMLRLPTIAYCVSQVLGPISASEWLLDADDDAPQEAKDWVTNNVLNHRRQIMPHALRSIIFGNAPFEVVWDQDGGKYIVAKYVPLLQDHTRVMREQNGKGPFAGLENGNAKLTPAECLMVLNTADVLGSEPGDDYGRSRLENLRDTAWLMWLDTNRRLNELEDRISGVVPIIMVPDGAPENGPLRDDGVTPKNYADLAYEQLAGLNHPRSQGAVIVVPGIGAADASIDPQRLKQLSTSVTTLDMGNRAASQTAMLEKLKYIDLMFSRGLLRGERTTLATDGGTKADAQTHTDSAMPDSEAIDWAIAGAINDQVVRTGLTLNFGPDVLKKIRGIKPAPLVDQDKIDARAAVAAFYGSDPVAKAAFFQVIDNNKLILDAKYPLLPGGDFNQIYADAHATAQENAAAMANKPPAKPANLSLKDAENAEALADAVTMLARMGRE